MPVRDEPLPTQFFERTSDFIPAEGSVYIYGRLPEDRSGHVEVWKSTASGVHVVEITAQTPSEFEVRWGGRTSTVQLRSMRQLAAFWAAMPRARTYLDITGLEHQVWAALLKSGFERSVELHAVYVEPSKYSFSATQTEGQIFDLSSRIKGITPLPGFATLSDQATSADWFVPLLGFEGPRLSHVIEHVQPSNDKVIPIVGVPGFRPEYPFHAYFGNKNPLLETGAWLAVRFAQANCPFSLFYLLRQLYSDRSGNAFIVAPIGTKPHGLGAIMFKVKNPAVEIVYDHPQRKANRTEGSDRLFVYAITMFLNGQP